MLKRPKEVTFEFPQPPAPISTFSEEWCLYWPEWCWQNNYGHFDADGAIQTMLFQGVHFSPSCAPGIDSAWDAWRKHVRIQMGFPMMNKLCGIAGNQRS